MKRLNRFNTILFASIVVLSVGCKPEEEDNGLDVPATYSFQRDGSTTVSYSGQTERLDMLEIITNTMKTGNTLGNPALDADNLKNMFRNSGNPFDGNTFGKDLISKCFSGDTTDILGWMDQIAANSAAQVNASAGTAGVLSEGNSDPNSGYLVNENGIELTQVISKTLMGSVFFYQAMESYLTAERMGTIGNDENADGKNYTNMEHYFDEAFGYFGVPVDFPDPLTIDDARFWGKYCNSRDEDSQSGINTAIMDAFKSGRTAIVNKKYEDRDAAIEIIAEKWGVVIGATAKDYLSSSLSSTGVDTYKKHHYLSEAIGFMNALKYHFENGNSKTTPKYMYSKVEEALGIIGMTTDLYSVTDTDIQNAINKLDEAFPNATL